MKKLLMVFLLAMSVNVQSQTWAELHEAGDATYLGGYFASVSYACLKTDYTDESGVWASGPASVPYEKGCAKAIWDAMFGEVATPYNR